MERENLATQAQMMAARPHSWLAGKPVPLDTNSGGEDSNTAPFLCDPSHYESDWAVMIWKIV